MAALSAAHIEKLRTRLSSIQHVVLVLSGKGGVGKSSTAFQLAMSLQAQGKRVGMLDVDLTGPSLPRMFGLEGEGVHQSSDGWVPVHVQGLRVMSIGFLLSHSGESVVWRGPKKTAMVRQMLAEVRWEDLDYLIIDTPPGTSDEHISLLEYLQQSQHPSLSSVLVTTPQSVSLADVSKELDFTRKTSLRVLGLVENMSGYACPHCDEITPIFGSGGGEAFATQEGLVFLGKVPLDSEFVKLVEGGKDQVSLRDRYEKTRTAGIFKPICQKIVELVETQN